MLIRSFAETSKSRLASTSPSDKETLAAVELLGDTVRGRLYVNLKVAERGIILGKRLADVEAADAPLWKANLLF